MGETIAVLDFGSQYTQVIARRIRGNRVFSQIYPFSTSASKLKKDGVKGIILSGGPSSVFGAKAPFPDAGIFEIDVPVLGICYGLQLIGNLLGGSVEASEHREYGHGVLKIERKGNLLARVKSEIRVWNSHGDRLNKLPPGFTKLGGTENSEFAAIENRDRRIYGLQFHPEVAHTDDGEKILRNFILRICCCKGDWSMADYIESSVRTIRETVGDKRVILGFSGGVDSSVSAALINRAVGKQLTCVFVDNGLLRRNERQQVESLYKKHFTSRFIVVKAGRKFLGRLKGVSDPERKRKIIGRTFIEVFEGEIKNLSGVEYLAQGTLYPDVIESVPIGDNPAALIKTHHNVGGLPSRLRLKLLEPLRELFKDEVRSLGAELGLPREVIWRHPFPGPGLAVRVVGEITGRSLNILREADAILIEEIKKSGFYYRVWQAFAVFLPVKTVGVMGDARTYENVVALRIVESTDAMTVDWARVPHRILEQISSRIINEVKGVNRVCLDISSKPPSTIEWE